MDGAVVVLYNPQSEELVNLIDYAGKVDITVIIDNSISNNLDQIENYVSVDGKRVIYEHHPENLGLCVGMNRGIAKLKDLDCSWVLTMNSDSHFKNDVLSIFRKFVLLNNCKDIAIIAPQYEYDRKKVKEVAGCHEIKWAMMSGNYVNTERNTFNH